jgi:hypothetical protein
MSAKPHLKVVHGQPVVVSDRTPPPLRENPLAAARRRAGGVFGWEKSAKEFPWTLEPRVLTTEWLAEQQSKRKTK